MTIEIDCTPVEARQFIGLPDVRPTQAAAAEIEKRMLAEAEKFSPEGFLRVWLAESQHGAEWFRDLFRGVFAQAAAARGEPAKD